MSGNMKALITASALFVRACGPNSLTMPPVESTVYVLVPHTDSASFTNTLASVVKGHGMRPSVGQATDDKGSVLHVLDAEGDGLRLRSENVLLSGNEDLARCGQHTEPHSDPGQFFISISSSSEAPAKQAAQSILRRVSSDLKAAGYTVLAKPVIWSGAAKA